MKILIVIPARYASTRLPGKPLIMIGEKSMIQRVYEQALKCKSAMQVLVAADDERIASEVRMFGGNVMMTSNNHQSGTERCAEVARNLKEDFEVIINVQGDEPFIAPEQIDLVAKCFENHTVNIATLIKKITNQQDVVNPNIVKAVIGEKQQALYFSRNAIPHLRGITEDKGITGAPYFKHIGIYGYRTAILLQLVKLPENNLERAESLEQLRWLANGFQIQTMETDLETIGIDAPDDLEMALKFLNK